MYWDSLGTIPSQAYVCGYCGSSVASEKGWVARTQHNGAIISFLYICHQCTKPTFLEKNGSQTLSVTFGNPRKGYS